MKLRLIHMGFALAPLALLCHNASAQNLSEMLNAAKAHDATYLAAKSSANATLARADQAQSALLPTVALTAGQSYNNIHNISNGALDRDGLGKTSTAISLSQPLYRVANWVTHQQGKQQAALVAPQLKQAEQELSVRVAQAYFDVLVAQEALRFVEAQKNAVSQQLAAAKRNFEVGTSTITDTREAQARYDLVLAQEMASQNDLRVKLMQLESTVGKSQLQPHRLHAPVALPSPSEPLEQWLEEARKNHPGIAQARIAQSLAKLEVDKAQAGHKPTVDLTMALASERYHNGYSSQSNTNSASIGVNATLPLFTGFATQNRIRETLALEEKAQLDLQQAQRSVEQAVRTAYLGLQSGLGQAKALETAEASSQSALDANTLGYQVGVRINIDVLNSQSQLFQTKRDLAKARYDVLLAQLRLKQAAGTLSGSDIDALTPLFIAQ
jgi:outer membrane protein